LAHIDEAHLITKLIADGDMRSVLRQKLTYQFFSDTTHKELFFFLSKRYEKFGRLPSMRIVQREFPEFTPQKTQEDLMELVEEVKTSKLYADMAVSLKEITEATRADPQEGFAKMREKVGAMILMHSSVDDVDFAKSADNILMEFKSRQDGVGLTGIQYPWPYLNKITLGMHPGDLIGIYARPKKLKTWLGLVIGSHAYMTTRKRVGFFNGEMSNEVTLSRLAALRARLPYQAFREGKLTNRETMRFRKAMRELADSGSFMICKIESTGDGAIAEIRAKCEEYQIDLAICDGVYFWMDDQTHKGFRTLTRGLKGIGVHLNIPVIAITQANRDAEKDKGKTTVGVAFGDSLAQDCDQLMHVIRDKQHEDQDEMVITLPAMREAKGGTFSIHAKPAEDFSQKFVFEDHEADTADVEEGSIM
jgi:replicative DNA helicase